MLPNFAIGQLRETLQRLAIALPDETVPILQALSIQVFEELASTNQTLWQAMEQGAREGAVAIALRQSAGRGQWGRSWQSGLGGLYLSLYLTPNLAADQSGQLTLCSAWGVATMLRQQGIPVRLKWCNDLILQGQKLGGILTETRVRGDRIHQAVVGIGVNWRNTVPPPGITLQQAGVAEAIATLEDLAAIVLVGLALGYGQWKHRGIDSIRPAYEGYLTGMGRILEIEGQSGKIIGVSSNGQLRLQLLHPDSQPPQILELPPGAISLGYPALD